MMGLVDHSFSGSLRLLALALFCVTLPASSLAQIHGVPAGATSLGPHGYGDDSGMTEPAEFARGEHHHHLGITPVPVMVPYYVPYFWAPEMTYASYDVRAQRPDPQPELQPAAAPASAPVKVEVKITDERASAKVDGQEAQPAEAASAKTPAQSAQQATAKSEDSAAVADFEPTVLVMRDGSRTEVRDYAIFGDDLVDLTGKPQRSIALAKIDMDATVAANAANGVVFRVPKVEAAN